MFDFLFDDSDGDGIPQSDRLQILSPEEYELLWGFPRFTQSDWDLFFTLTAPEREALEQRRSIRTKIHFLLHLGYFRARQRFFRFELPAVRDDVDYLRRRYFDNRSLGLIPTRLKRYLMEPSGAIVRDRYEFMVYRQLREQLEELRDLVEGVFRIGQLPHPCR